MAALENDDLIMKAVSDGTMEKGLEQYLKQKIFEMKI